MANKNRVLGQATVKVDGETFSTAGDTQLEIGGPSREAVTGDYEAGAFMEKTMPAKATVNLLYKAGVSLANLRAIDNATVTVETDIGETWLMSNAYVAEVISFSSSDGKAQLVFQSGPAEQVNVNV